MGLFRMLIREGSSWDLIHKLKSDKNLLNRREINKNGIPSTLI